MKRLAGLFWVYLGHWFRRHGMVGLAEACYRNGTERGGRHSAQAWFYLGKSLLDRDVLQDAVVALEGAVQCDPHHARAWCGLGAAHRLLADLPAAHQAYAEAIRANPDYAQALSNLGELCLIQGDAALALAYFEKSLAREPNLLEALSNRVAALFELGRYIEAEEAALRAIALFPLEAATHVNHGNVLLHTGKARTALLAFQKALECDPACAEAHLNLATLLGESHHLTHVIGFIEQEIALKGETAQRLGALGLAQSAKKDYAAAAKTCERALEIQPSHVSAMITLAGCFGIRGDHRGAMALQQRALQINQNMSAIFSNVSFEATYRPDLSAEEIFDHHKAWSQRFELPVNAIRYRHEAGEARDRRLRIGYVSGDFGHHPVGFLLLDVLRHHDHAQYEIHCFSMMRKDDAITVAIREQADVWHDALLMSTEDLAKEIHEKQIDILIDLSGHTAYNRLPTFALTPAPIQITWIGYFHSTGLEGIDYFITDPYTSPRGCQQLFSETPVWLPHSRFCFSPPGYSPEVGPLPMLAKGHVTFGSFNRTEKYLDPVIAAWAKILTEVADSHLIIKAGALEDDSIRTDLLRRFALAGIDGDRLELRGPSSHDEMLKQYGEIDIALDTFPFNGGMTTIEALWMGVPVVTIAGHGVVARQTVSALTNLGLEELAFPDEASFIQGAVALATDPERMVRLRRQLRPRMEASPLRQSAQFANDLEALYRRMWWAWCEGTRLAADI